MSEEKKNFPESVTLSTGVVVTKKRTKVKDLAESTNQPKGKEYLSNFATFAAKVLFNDKPVVLEDILDLYEDDLELITSLFFTEEELKNA